MHTEGNHGANPELDISDMSRSALFLRQLSLASVLITAAIGLLSFAGWLSGRYILASMGSGFIPVAPSSALFFLLIASSILIRLIFPLNSRLLSASVITASALAAASVVLLFLSVKGIQSEIEHLGIEIINSPGELAKGHMSPVTAICFIAAAVSFLTSRPSAEGRPWVPTVSLICAAVPAGIGAIFMLAYLYGIPFMYGGSYIPPAVLTVVAFFFLGISLLCQSLPQQGFYLKDIAPALRTSYSLIVIFCMLSLGIIIAGYLYYSHYEKQLRHSVEQKLTAIADLKSDELVNWRNERIDDGRIFYLNDNFSGMVLRYIRRPADGDIRNMINIWLGHIRMISHYERVFLLKSDGSLMLAEPAQIGSVSPHLAATSREALSSGRIMFEDFHRDENNGRIYLGIIVPIITPETGGRAIAALVLHIDPEKYLYPFIKRWPSPSESAETLLVRRDGDEVLFLNELRFEKDTALKLRRPLNMKELPAAQAVLGRKGIMEGRDYRGVAVIADLRAVPDSPWFLVTRMDLSEVYAPLKERLWLVVGLVFVLLVGSGTGVGMLWRHQNLIFYKEQFEAAEEIGHLNSSLKNLIESVKELASARDLETIQKIVRTAARKLTGADGAAMVYRVGDSCFYADEDAIGPLWKGQKFPMSACISGWAMLNKKSVIIEDIYADDRIPADAYRPTFVKSLVMVPINTTEPIGAIGNYWADYHKATEMEVQLLQTLADAASRAIENVRLYESLEQRVAERTAELEAVNKELEGFSYSISHDLRAPLRHITGFAELLMKKAPAALDEKNRHYLDVISEAAMQMGKLVDDLLSFSRMGRAEMVHKRVDLEKVVSDVIEVMKPDIVQRDIIWKLGSLPEVYGDPSMLRLVFENLISNAIKFTGNRQQAVIETGSLSGDDHEMILYVRDNGVGFDMRYVDKLFGLFQRLHRAEEFAGTGLGLANVRRIIHRHGGRTWAEGALDKGAAIYFSLPRKREREVQDGHQT